jgi:PAS domain S-box-containing protein
LTHDDSPLGAANDAQGTAPRLQALEWLHRLLDTVSRAQSRFISHGTPHQAFQELLADLLKLTESRDGFIAEVVGSSRHDPPAQLLATTYIDQGSSTTQQREAVGGPLPDRVGSLLQQVINSAKPLLINTADGDAQTRGTPPFVGIPIHRGMNLIGVVALEGRTAGYAKPLVRDLQPFIATCGNLIEAYRGFCLQQETQKRLSSSETRLRAVLDTVVDGIITIDDHGRIESVNRAISRMFGYAENELLGQNVRMLMNEPERSLHDGYVARYRSARGTRKPAVGRVVSGRRKNGELFPLELSLSEAQIEGGYLITGIIRDISDRRHAEAALAESNRLKQSILDSANFSIIATDLQGIIRTFNRGAQRMLGYSAEEVEGKCTPAIIHVKDEVVRRAKELTQELGVPIAPGFEAFVAKARRGFTDERVWTYVRKDGGRLPVLLSVSPLREEDGSISGFLGIAADMTERETISRLKDDFISTVSHELRTPLTSIRGSLGLIQGGALGTLPDKMRSVVEIALRNSERLSLLINDILDIEKIEAGKMRFDMKRQPLMPVVERAMEAHRSYGLSHKVEFRLGESANDAMASFDADRIDQVMANLLSNAAKFSPPDSTVEISVRRQAGALCVSVADHGPGIAPEFHDRIFHKFAQADSSSTRQKGGSGLGLAICKAIIEKHEGQIGFETGHNGSTFHFILPEDSGASAAADEHHGARRVLLSGGPLAPFDTLAKDIRIAGFSCERVADPRELRHVVANEQPFGLILDISTPTHTLARQFRELLADDRIKPGPLVLSAWQRDAEGQCRGGALGVAGWLAKPIDPERLLQRIRQAIGNTGSAGARLLHVEDDTDVVVFARALLEEAVQIEHAGTVALARQRLQDNHYDALLLDVHLPDGTGLDLIPQVARLANPLPVVICSAIETGDHALRAISAGLLRAEVDGTHVAHAVRSLLARNTQTP